MRHRLFLVAGILAGLMVGAQAHGQRTPAGAGPGSSAGAGPVSTAGVPQPRNGIGETTNYENPAEQQRGGTSFEGKVVVQGGELPWDPIPVVVACNGVVRYRTEANGKGQFTIRSSRSASLMAPAGQSARQATASQLIGCDVQASVPGFKSSTLHIANRGMMDDLYLGTITLRPDTAAAGSSMSATTAAAPKDGIKKFDKARSEWLSGNPNGAARDLEKAVKIDPQFAEAWYQLGKLQERKNDDKKALASYQQAVAADPKYISPYEGIAELSSLEKKWQDVANAADAALKLDPAGTPQLWYLDALGKYNLGKVDEAEVSARKSIAMDPQHQAPNTEQLLAVILAGKGQLAEALKHLENSLTYMKPGPNRELVKQQIAQLEKALPQSSGK